MGIDVRVCFLGDSLVAGVGDPDHLGWAGRLAARTHQAGWPLTVYNLGVRRDTTADALRRGPAECAARLPAGSDAGVVISLGVNDTTLEGGRPRIAAPYSAANLDMLLRHCRDARWPVLVVGPPPVEDEAQNDRIAGLDGLFASLCQRRAVPYVSVLPVLRGDPIWRREVFEGDGAHPGRDGYTLLADLVLPAWDAWVGGLFNGRWTAPWA